jgi:SagB-type dehydrogenase family enzyme
MTSPRRIRRARALQVAWRDHRLVLMNYQTLSWASADPEAIRMLDRLEDWTVPGTLNALFPEYTPASIRHGIRELVRNTFVVEEGTRAAKRDADVASVWESWLPEASFHFATKDVEYAPAPASLFREYFAESPQPPRVKRYPGAKPIELAKPNAAAADRSFCDVLLARKTHRDFSRRQISLVDISNLLYFTWGVMGRIDAPPFGRLFHKTSPSGGARHPGEVYVLAMRVKGLAQGLYHYDCLHHRLEQLRTVPGVKKALAYTANQEFVADASALFIMSAVFPRVLWKYRFARSYRIVLLDAGHLCQTFCLVATWLGLAPFCTAAFEDSLIEGDLGLDGIRESVLYLAGVGTPLDGNSRSAR